MHRCGSRSKRWTTIRPGAGERLAARWRCPSASSSECGNLAATLLMVQAGDLLASDHSPQRAASLALVLDLGYDAAALDRSASRR
jgi:hypothetical protein